MTAPGKKRVPIAVNQTKEVKGIQNWMPDIRTERNPDFIIKGSYEEGSFEK